MIKKIIKKDNIVKFPNKLSQIDKEIEGILLQLLSHLIMKLLKLNYLKK